MPFDREQMKAKAGELAARGVLVGTSSWKYEGWLDQIYTPGRYVKRAKATTGAQQDFFAGLQAEPLSRNSEKMDSEKFEDNCLTEYAEVFKTVCVDSAFYRFPSQRNLEALAAQVPPDFRFGFKVTDEITIKRFPNTKRHGSRGGKSNENFLNASLFGDSFLQPCEAIRSKVGVLIFEFSRFYPSDYADGREFFAELDAFLDRLPRGWPYAVELRNQHWLGPEYFACLSKHGVTHVFNSWEAMPTVSEQMALPGSMTNPGMVAARFLLKQGRDYETAVKKFGPLYKLTKEVNQEARKAIAALIKAALAATGGNLIRALIFINNRLEGNALNTIAAVLESGDWR
jgi:uncharacterized protein YecE (DUF72 family)